MAKDYYELLGVERDATGQDIKKAFRQIARECHPDVSGDDPEAEDRFKKARIAYETLMDPVTRARYDRRDQRRTAMGKGGSFFDDFFRRTGEKGGGTPAGAPARTGPRPTKKNDPRNNIGLDDLFTVGEFGFGSANRGRENTGGAPESTTRQPMPGQDVMIELELPAFTASRGGSVTAVYRRMQRSDSWRPGSQDSGLVEVEDIADIRIIPSTRNGELLREKGLGSAGAFGGGYGDLIARVKIVADPMPRPAEPRPPERPYPGGPSPRPAEPEVRTAAPPPTSATEEVVILEIGVVEALLGGRVALDTPQGRLRLTIPPCTSSGTRLRLKGKGSVRNGAPDDLYVELRIMVPRVLDEESRRLIEEFARLNP